MLLRIINRSWLVLLALAWGACPELLRAQDDGGGGLAGVVVDADGVMKLQVLDARLNQQRIAAARQNLNPQVAAQSEMRMISLNRLEAAVAAQLAGGRRPTDEMRYLAGLTRIQYVFLYPESGDIVIAGPAEGWVEDVTGRVRGLETGRPVVELQDLITALRAFPPGQNDGPVIGCSIDPTQEGLANMQAFLKQLGTRLRPDQINTQAITTGLQQSLGLQLVRVMGVPPTTHFAQVLVEADYRMKLIGIGLERPPVKIRSYVEQASPAQVSKNAMQRWYFTPDYNCVRISEDSLAMELVGQGVKLVNADEIVNADGQRLASGSVDRASRSFVHTFTEKYPQLAAKSPIYAQLRNMIDLAVFAAFMQRQDYYGLAGWRMETFGDEQLYPVETYQTPAQVESAVNALFKGGRLMLPIGGGVQVEAQQALLSENLLVDERGAVATQRSQISLDGLQPGQWWWD